MSKLRKQSSKLRKNSSKLRKRGVYRQVISMTISATWAKMEAGPSLRLEPGDPEHPNPQKYWYFQYFQGFSHKYWNFQDFKDFQDFQDVKIWSIISENMVWPYQIWWKMHPGSVFNTLGAPKWVKSMVFDDFLKSSNFLTKNENHK